MDLYHVSGPWLLRRLIDWLIDSLRGFCCKSAIEQCNNLFVFNCNSCVICVFKQICCALVSGVHHVRLELEQFTDNGIVSFEIHRRQHIGNEGIWDQYVQQNSYFWCRFGWTRTHSRFLTKWPQSHVISMLHRWTKNLTLFCYIFTALAFFYTSITCWVDLMTMVMLMLDSFLAAFVSIIDKQNCATTKRHYLSTYIHLPCALLWKMRQLCICSNTDQDS